MRHTMQKTGRLLAALALSGVLLASGLMAQAAPAPQPGSKGLELEVTEMDLEITEEDPRPRAYLYTGSSSDYYFINNDHSFIYVYQWLSSNPEVATVDGNGLVTAQGTGGATITALASNGQAVRCTVTVTSDIGRVTLNKNDLLFKTVGSKETLTASVALESGGSVPITWVSSNPGVATVDPNGVVTAVADGEAKITALSPEGRFDTCSVLVGIAAEKYASEEDLADELKLPDPYVAVRLNRLS